MSLRYSHSMQCSSSREPRPQVRGETVETGFNSELDPGASPCPHHCRPYMHGVRLPAASFLFDSVIQAGNSMNTSDTDTNLQLTEFKTLSGSASGTI